MKQINKKNIWPRRELTMAGDQRNGDDGEGDGAHERQAERKGEKS